MELENVIELWEEATKNASEHAYKEQPYNDDSADVYEWHMYFVEYLESNYDLIKKPVSLSGREHLLCKQEKLSSSGVRIPPPAPIIKGKNIMRCFGKFYDNNICDLCERIDGRYYSQCKAKVREEIEKTTKLMNIMKQCPYAYDGYYDRDSFIACSLGGKKYLSQIRKCEVKLECENL